MNKYDHDVSAVLLADGVPVVAIPKERLTRVKNAAGLPDAAVGYCLDAAGISLDDIDLIVQNSYALNVPELELDLLSRVHALHLPAGERELAMTSRLFRNAEAVTISHHLAHAYSAFAASPFESGAVMVVDGVGSHRRDVTEELPADDDGHDADRESESYYAFDGTSLRTVKKEWLRVRPGVLSEDFTKLAGLGAVYSRVSEYVFAHWNKCGEVMGLAAFGAESDGIPQLMGVRDGRTWALTKWPDHLSNPWLDPGDDSPRAERRRHWEENLDLREWQDLCWRVQHDLEEALIARAYELHAATGARDLVCAGGVMLNCVANSRIWRETPFERVWVQPAAGDSGVALGCALYGEHAVKMQPRRFVMGTDGLGRTYTGEDIDAAMATKPFAPFVKVTTSDDVHADAAALIADGLVVGWFQGGGEFGPRALGQRSIVADPRNPDTKRRLNETVKHRQAFRPFAPAVLAEKSTLR